MDGAGEDPLPSRSWAIAKGNWPALLAAFAAGRSVQGEEEGVKLVESD